VNWPAYFQPSSSSAPPNVADGQPICILDVFQLAHPGCAPELFVVVGLEQGGLRVVRAADISSLPETLQRQLRAALVSKRGAVRTLQISQLFLLTLDSIEQRVMSGLNDAVLLFGQACGCVERSLSGWDITSSRQPGALTVGRLDMLHGYILGFEYVWRNPESSGDFISHLFLPAGPLADVQRGRSLALVYPLFETDTTNAVYRADNTSLVLRLVYDLLFKLQQELAQTGSNHAFAQAILPVPNRQRVEYELAANGYEIHGNEAVRVGKTQPNTELDWLEKVRRWASSRNAPRIALPPQAKPRDYRILSKQALSIAANHDDQAVMVVLDQRIQRDSKITQTTQMKAEPNPNDANAPIYKATPRFNEVRVTPSSQGTATPQVRVPKGEDWSKDFDKPVVPQHAKKTEDWSSDFDSVSDDVGDDVGDNVGDQAGNEAGKDIMTSDSDKPENDFQS